MYMYWLVLGDCILAGSNSPIAANLDFGDPPNEVHKKMQAKYQLSRFEVIHLSRICIIQNIIDLFKDIKPLVEDAFGTDLSHLSKDNNFRAALGAICMDDNFVRQIEDEDFDSTFDLLFPFNTDIKSKFKNFVDAARDKLIAFEAAAWEQNGPCPNSPTHHPDYNLSNYLDLRRNPPVPMPGVA